MAKDRLLVKKKIRDDLRKHIRSKQSERELHCVVHCLHIELVLKIVDSMPVESKHSETIVSEIH